MAGFMNGFAQGLNQTYQSGGNDGSMSEYQAKRLEQQQASTDAQVGAANASKDYSIARTEGQDLKNKQLQLDQEFNNGVTKAASVGGFSAAIDFANKQGRYEWSAERLKEQQELNSSLAQGKKLDADATKADLEVYNTRQKALGGLAGAFYTDINNGKKPEQAYNEYLPTLKQIWPGAPDKFDGKTDSMLKIALSQSLQQNANFSRMSNVGKLLQERAAAVKAGDPEVVKFYDGQLQKASMFVNQQTGEVYNLMGTAPDTNTGSVDTKANAMGLGAGSVIPPVQGAAFHIQPMNNVMDNKYKAYDRDNGIPAEVRTIKNMKMQPGYNNIILPDGTNMQESIVGGKEDTVKGSASETVRFEALQAGQTAFNKISDILLDSKGEVKPEALGLLGDISQSTMIGSTGNALADYAINAVTSNNAQLLRARQDVMIEGITRGLTGASKNLSETPELKRMLLPQPGDGTDTIKAKLEMTHEILNGSLNILKYGLKGALIRDENGAAKVDLDLVNKALEYVRNGGDILDITKGSGANPEKARLAQLKKLSYDPALVKKVMSAQTNGQGKDFTEAEAKGIIDGMNMKKKEGQ